MLTLQQLLESDSIATIVAKLNTNFQVISASNGGPQGIRGVQGIPGLPGRQGPTGPLGPTGPTGTIIGIIPFAAKDGGITNVGPVSGSLAPNGESAEPWPYSSWVWLMYYYGAGVSTANWAADIPNVVAQGVTIGGATANHGDVFIDHANAGYWKYLTGPDIQGADDGITYAPFSPSGYTAGGYYTPAGPTATYPKLDPVSFPQWVGAGWYYYPQSAGGLPTGTVWVEDKTTYLIGPTGQTGPYKFGPALDDATSPLTVKNARLITKYGTVWITSGNDGTTASIGDGDYDTSTIGKWGWTGAPSVQDNPGRVNAGVDRLMFKMSIDNIPYLNNVNARGYTLPPPDALVGKTGDYPLTYNAGATATMNGYEYWIKPQYATNIGEYTPLLFFSERNPDLNDIGEPNDYSSLALYMHTGDVLDNPVTKEGYHKSLFTWSTRAALDPLEMYDTTPLPINAASTVNYGEVVMDFRRLIASNQYVCSIPADMYLSSDYISLGNYDENNGSNAQRYREYQGYISAINGKSLTGDLENIDYWEYGLGGLTGGTASGYTGGIHDGSLSNLGFQTRRTWYGSAVFDENPSDWETLTPGEGNYIRVAGMQERGRRFNSSVLPGGGEGDPNTWLLSELLFYTSQFNVSETTGGVSANASSNQHKSLPSLYISPFRNIGVGTFVGGPTASNDQGPLEPSAKLHVHAKFPNVRSDDPAWIYRDMPAGTGKNSLRPTKTFAVGAFTRDAISNSDRVGYLDIYLGAVRTLTGEAVTPSTNIINPMNPLPGADQHNMMKSAIRLESWYSGTPADTFRLGVIPSQGSGSTASIGRNSINSLGQEFQFAIHPLTYRTDGALTWYQGVAGVGLHNLYPRARVHTFGKNLYNEQVQGPETAYPGNVLAGGLVPGGTAGITNTLPFYGVTASNSPSNNQIVLDYIGNSYTYPVGIYEYQYFVFNGNSNDATVPVTNARTPNAAVYPNREKLSPTRNSVPYWVQATIDGAFPTVSAPFLSTNSTWRHGGIENGWFEPTSYIGFNLFRGIDPATNSRNNIFGDNADANTWVIGTRGFNSIGSTAAQQGNNGAAALMFSPHGELGIVTIPRGRDGGYPYEQWEQRGLSTRDVLNQMKIVFDQNGNLAIGNGAGWDLDAYPSLDMNPTTGYLNYVPPASAGLTSGATTAAGTTYTYTNWLNGRRYGNVAYNSIGYGSESASSSPASQINANATRKEYIRLEVAAEKAWSRDGRSLMKNGYGYPPNLLDYNIANSQRYVKLASPYTFGGLRISTDADGRITRASMLFVQTSSTSVPTGFTAGSIQMVAWPHPTEFNAGGPLGIPGFGAPAGAMAAEWSGMARDNYSDYPEIVVYNTGASAWDIELINTIDERGQANVRMNNFVYGEGYGYSGAGMTAGTTALPNGNGVQGRYTIEWVKKRRQESPRLIMTFLEGTPSPAEAARRENTGGVPLGNGTVPYKKVNTVIASAQNESPLREYWIPKADNTGGTFMVFTDHMGSKEKEDGFDNQLTKITGLTAGGATGSINKLKLSQVVTLEVLFGYTSGTGPAMITNRSSVLDGIDTSTISMGYVNYFNTDWSAAGGGTPYFAAGEYGEKVQIGAPVPGIINTSPNNPSANGLTVISGNTAAMNAVIRRNVDEYYTIYAGSTANYDGGWGNGDIENRATEIRFKRINSEYALVDFNITVEVNNEQLPGGTGDQNSYIDTASPRMTQYLQFMYVVDEDELREGYTEDLYGGGPWFSNWSSYRNWYSGAAVVGGDIVRDDATEAQIPGSNSLANGLSQSDSPFFADRLGGLNRTWNGNFIDPGYYYFDQSGPISPFVAGGRLGPILGSGNFGPFSQSNPIHSGFGNATINSRLSFGLFDQLYLDLSVKKQRFTDFMGSFYSVYGNHFMSRARNMMWRMVPYQTASTEGSTNTTRNSFMLEVMFDTPILHVDTPFAKTNFGGETTTTEEFYKYLTVSGQAIVRYARTSSPAGGGAA